MSLEERVAKAEEQLKTLFSMFTSVHKSIEKMENKLLGRPSWAVSSIIAILSSLCVGLIVALAKRGF